MSQQLHPPKPVKLIVGMLSRDEGLFVPAESKMAALWGAIDITSKVMAFEQTRYYEKEMGTGLRRKFVAFVDLIRPEKLACVKHQSNAIEAELAATEAKRLGVARPINLDPGYVEPSKLVLATTKNYSHRIYIGENMYAEATLRYHQGQWQGWPFTYPDYASGAYFDFLTSVRERLMEQLSSQS
ncbi:MAG: DUF4416 family protein [Sedimentisphaerales bacterium]|nr:DUF4416 family protein [Sedimentisphaerales bacterium]